MVSQGHPDENQPDIGPESEGNPGTPIAVAVVANPPGLVSRSTWILTLSAGIAAAIFSWMSTEGVLTAYRPLLMPPMKPMPTTEDAMQIMRARIASGTLAFGAMGGILGLAFGLAGGASRRSSGAAAVAGILGLIVGSTLLAGVARLVLPVIYTQLDPQAHDLVVPLLYHEALWSVAGAVGGLMFGLGSGRRGLWKRTSIGGWAGTVLAIVLNELVGALAFPTYQTQFPVSNSPETRALAHGLVGLGAAIGVVLSVEDSRPRPVKG